MPAIVAAVERAMDAKTFDKAKPSSRYRDEPRACAPGRFAFADLPVIGAGGYRLVEQLPSAPCSARSASARSPMWRVHRSQAAVACRCAGEPPMASDPDSSDELTLKKVKLNQDQNVAHTVYHPISAMGGATTGRVLELRGASKSEDAVGKIAGMKQLQLQRQLRAVRRFGGENVDGRGGDVLPAHSRPFPRELTVFQAEARPSWAAPGAPYQSGVLRSYRGQVGPSRKGAVTVTHAGGRADVVCDADL
jgi:hypothetical protein